MGATSLATLRAFLDSSAHVTKEIRTLAASTPDNTVLNTINEYDVKKKALADTIRTPTAPLLQSAPLGILDLIREYTSSNLGAVPTLSTTSNNLP